MLTPFQCAAASGLLLATQFAPHVAVAATPPTVELLAFAETGNRDGVVASPPPDMKKEPSVVAGAMDDAGDVAEATRPRPEAERVKASQPGHVSRGFFDTGRGVRFGGIDRSAPGAMLAVVHRVDQRDAPYGWERELAGAEQLDPIVHRLAAAPDTRDERDTRITGLDEPPQRYAIWLALGGTSPQRSFSNQHKGGLAVTLGYEHILTPSFSAEATLGRHNFHGKYGGGEIDVTQFGANGKLYFARTGFKPFLTLGVSGYAFDPGSTRSGANVGIGVQVDMAPQWSAEGRYTLHQVTGNAPNSSYSTLQIGLRFAW